MGALLRHSQGGTLYATRHLAVLLFSWYGLRMEATPFELTPAQKCLLESLARETGKAIPALLDEALEELQAHVRQHAVSGEPHSSNEDYAAPPPHETSKPIWEQFIEAFKDVP